MGEGTPQSTLREWRRHMTRLPVLAALAGCGAVLGIAGPFGTDALLRLVPRVAYWGALAFLTYGFGALVHLVLAPRLGSLRRPVRSGAIGLATALGVCAIVVGVNAAVFGWLPDAAALPGFLATVAAITLIVTAVLEVTRPEDTSDVTQGPAPILQRLPLEKRGALVALSVEDHYTRVRTAKGEALLLMRLSDAIRETEGVAGLQVHRSHWVALGQVKTARRAGDRAILTMVDGTEVPVSRANVSAIKEAGLLPR